MIRHGSGTDFNHGLRALEFFFCRPDAAGRLPLPEGLPGLLAGALRRAASGADPAPGSAQLTHYLNALHEEGAAAKKLMAELFSALVRHGLLPRQWRESGLSPHTEFLLEQAETLLEALKALPRQLDSTERTEVSPEALLIFDSLPQRTAGHAALCSALENADPFSGGRCFLFRSGRLLPVEPESIKPPEKFFGFAGMRAIYRDHFADFTAGKCSVPLLIHSLPGYGKTSMVLSYALATPEISVVLPEPAILERGWEPMIEILARRPDRRFVIFFDDIDPRTVDWYQFRTNVGGAFSPPGNIMVVLSSNYEFPAGILSRGRRMSYPVFDELRCTEMVEDFLRDFGLKRPPKNLVSLIAADYTEEFGQKKFTELSPRTLMRYLSVYGMSRSKRRTIAELSMGEVITRPDAELFHEFNIGLMRSLYGEEYIQRLLKEKLKKL